MMGEFPKRPAPLDPSRGKRVIPISGDLIVEVLRQLVQDGGLTYVCTSVTPEVEPRFVTITSEGLPTDIEFCWLFTSDPNTSDRFQTLELVVSSAEWEPGKPAEIIERVVPQFTNHEHERDRQLLTTASALQETLMERKEDRMVDPGKRSERQPPPPPDTPPPDPSRQGKQETEPSRGAPPPVKTK